MTGIGAALISRYHPSAIRLVAHTQVSSGVTATTPAIDTTGASLLVVIQSQYVYSPTAVVTDSKSNVWSFLTSQSSTIPWIQIGYIATPIVGPGHTFTKTVLGNDYGTLLVLAFAGGGTFSGAQTGASNGSAGTSLAVGSVIPARSSSLIVSGLCTTNGSTLPYFIDSGFLIGDSTPWVSGGGEGGASAYLIQAAPSAINATWGWTGSSLSSVASAVFNPASVGTKVAPAQAVAAGFTTLVFDDDFTSNTVLANSGSATTPTAGYNWYWKQATSTSNAVVNTTATASSISNGNTRGGNYASSAGGILTLTGVAGNTSNIGLLQSVPPNLTNGTTNPPGAFQHYYVEAYIQFVPTSSSTSGWVGFWSWALNALFGELYGPGVEHTEIDMAEYYATATPATVSANVHEWSATDTSITQSNFYDSTFTQDGNWHVYGCLWTGNGTTGNLTFYRDNVSYATLAVGAGSSYPACESSKQYLALSAGQGWIVNIDWVRVWQ